MQPDPSRKGAHAVVARMATMLIATVSTMPFDFLAGQSLDESVKMRAAVLVLKVAFGSPYGAARERIIERTVTAPHGTVKNRLEKGRIDSQIYACYVVLMNGIVFVAFGLYAPKDFAILGGLLLGSIVFGPVVGLIMDTLTKLFGTFATWILAKLTR